MNKNLKFKISGTYRQKKIGFPTYRENKIKINIVKLNMIKLKSLCIVSLVGFTCSLFYAQWLLSFVFNIAKDCRYHLWSREKILQHVFKKRCLLSSHSQQQSDFICHKLWFIKEVANNQWQIGDKFFVTLV